jgi:hypothetical protein
LIASVVAAIAIEAENEMLPDTAHAPLSSKWQHCPVLCIFFPQLGAKIN